MPISAKDIVEKEPKKIMTTSGAGNCTIRCSVEKRSYCRELQKWSKNLLYMVGLENVAKKLTDKRSWIKISPFIDTVPSKNSSKCETPADCLDWNPEEHCPICKGKGKEKTTKHVENHKVAAIEPKQTKEVAPIITTPSTDLFDMSSLSRSSLENVTYPSVPYYDLSQAYLSQLMLHWSKLGPFSLPPPIGPLLLPFAAPNLLQQTTQQSSSCETGAGLFQSTVPSLSAQISSVSEEPLDLSVKPMTNTAQNVSKPNKNISNNVPQIPAQNSNASKKTYSQADLEAAVQDIRCGKLGTRRASVVYGIPRSTLRNKIYKLEASEEGGAARKKKKPANNTNGNAPNASRVQPPPVVAAPPEKSPNASVTSEESSENSSAGQAYCQSAATEKLVTELAKYRATSISNCWSGANVSLADFDSLNGDEMSQSALVKSVLEDAAHSALLGQLKSSTTTHTSKRPASIQLGKSPDSVKRPRSVGSPGNESPPLDRFDPNRKVRPKRGQYRRYDKNALAEAVQSVRRGEMSVHRAGSYYGVPHSTLEYKVKERNLLRPKKRDQARLSRENSGPSSSAAVAAVGGSPLTGGQKSGGGTGGSSRRRSSTTKQESLDSTNGNEEPRAYSPISREILNYLKTSPSSVASSSTTNDVSTIWRLPTLTRSPSKNDAEPAPVGSSNHPVVSETPPPSSDVFSATDVLQTNVKNVVPILN